MSSSVLEAIRDWCKGKFQPKGDYLTSVPEEYVTETELESKNYATKDEIISGTSGVTAEEVEGLIGASFLENMSGAKIAQDAEGNWGLLAPGADAVIPFIGSEGGEFVSPIALYKSVASTSFVKDIIFGNNCGGYKKIKIRGSITTSSNATCSISFNGYKKDENGNRASNITSTYIALNYSGSNEFEGEIDFDAYWFGNDNNYNYCPYIASKKGTTSQTVSFSIDEIVYYK